ncbi:MULTISPECIES: type II secretion system minor pseudopilin GspK [unclassified Serratia (in: enterobacteria)]|uniref:type II secretion system minor pseudopilin GspK n=1 Tax=unclassified Serratia (in: enterobacteria) TaxID=2647522 RepID=UPI00046AFD56|nr:MULTISPECIES: type II secretion system minor pseudopilin GspK [unclassified Serratia (in: enterobacteria)]
MKREQGVALLMVMLLLALMATIAVGINQFWFSAFNRTLNQQSRMQAKWALLGGETFARQWLAESLQSEPVVHLGQRWARPGQSLRTEDGNIAITFSDAQACFNINSLNYRIPTVELSVEQAAPATEDSSAPVFKPDIAHQVFNALLVNLGFSEAEARQLSDSIKAQLAPGSVAFADISELRPMPGVEHERLLQLSPLLCALPEQKPGININTLGNQQLPLLQALFLNQASRNTLQQLLAARPVNGWNSVSDPAFQQTLQALRLPSLEGEKLLATRSHYFYAHLTTEGEKGDYRLQSFLRYERKKISVIERQLRFGRKQP